MPEKRSAACSEENGFASLLVLVIIFTAAGLILAADSKSTSYLPISNSQVEGVYLAKGGDDSGSSSGGSGSSGSSDSGSHDSGSSSGSSGSSGSSSSGSSESSSGSSGDSKNVSQPSTVKTPISSSLPKVEIKSKNEQREKEQEKIKDQVKQEQELEVENEIERELEKPEITEVEFKNVAGEIEVEVKEATKSARALTKGKTAKLTLNLTKKKGEKEVKLLVEGGGFKVESKGEEAETHFSLSLNDNGQLFVNTPKGAKQIRILPDQASEIARKAGVQTQIQKIELVEDSSLGNNHELVFKISGVKMGQLLGLIPVVGAVESEVEAQNGALVKIEQPLWLRLLSPLIQ